MTNVYRDLSLEEVLSEYQPALHVPQVGEILQGYGLRGEAARAAVPHQKICYGDQVDEWLWFVPGPQHEAPLLVFIHGGYWRRLSADDGCLLAPGAVAMGCAFASINYTLCPAGTLDLLVDQTRRAINYLADHGAALGFDPLRMHVSGHSAGGHLAAMASISDPRPAGYVMVSGVFDITPIVHTPINDDVRMSPADAIRLSPMAQMVPRRGVPCITTWGALESAEFRRQSIEFAQRWSEIPGNGDAAAIESPARHHFDVIDDLVIASSPLGSAVRQQIFG